MPQKHNPLNKPLSHDEISALSKIKLFADNNFIVAQMVQFLFAGVEYIVGKEKKMLDTSTYYFSHNVLQKAFSSGEPEVIIVSKGLLHPNLFVVFDHFQFG